jgi:hypothetical protein
MFSHYVNNSNNITITNDFYAVPFGQRCTSALACKYANIRFFSLPFDWTIPLFPSTIKKILENNFENFLPDASVIEQNAYFNIYDIALAHFNPDTEKGIEEYKRRIDRFNYIMHDSKKKYFVFINEDYLYNNNYRDDNFNNHIFNEMLELEQFLKEKYTNIDYNILYFNFKHHVIPENSNIINIVLHTTNVYDNEKVQAVIDFRQYCASILAGIFGTKLNCYSNNDHNV